MRFEEIPKSIKNTINRYEQERNIQTIDIIQFVKKRDIAFMLGLKSDNTQTLFIAYKTTKWRDDSWVWWCPSEVQIESLTNSLHDVAYYVEAYNKRTRKA